MPRTHHEEVLFVVSLPAYLTTVWLFSFMDLCTHIRVLVSGTGFEPVSVAVKGR